MKYYQNIKTGEIIGIENMRQVIDLPDEQSRKLGRKDHSYTVVYDMIHPNKILGRGIVSYCTTNAYLKENYKRIRREIALSKYPNFEQYRYKHLPPGTHDERLNVIKNQTF